MVVHVNNQTHRPHAKRPCPSWPWKLMPFYIFVKPFPYIIIYFMFVSQSIRCAINVTHKHLQWSGTCSPCECAHVEDWKRFSSLSYSPTFHTFTFPSLCSLLSVESLSAGHALPVMWYVKYTTCNQSSAGHVLPVKWPCLKETTKSMYCIFMG